jgi:hypothetical protein
VTLWYLPQRRPGNITVNLENGSYRELRAWFEQRYGRSVAASSVSEILSSRYDHLDQSNFQRSAKRQRVEKWPELELALIQWVSLSWH